MSVYEAVREDKTSWFPNMKETRLLKILTAEMLPPKKKKGEREKLETTQCSIFTSLISQANGIILSSSPKVGVKVAFS